MASSGSGTGDDRFLETSRGSVLLGLVDVLVGVGLFYSIATDSFGPFAAVLVGILGTMALSLYVVVRREGLRTRENEIIGGCVLVAVGLLFGLSGFTALSSDVVFAIVFAVGVVVPHLLVEHTAYGTPG